MKCSATKNKGLNTDFQTFTYDLSLFMNLKTNQLNEFSEKTKLKVWLLYLRLVLCNNKSFNYIANFRLLEYRNRKYSPIELLTYKKKKNLAIETKIVHHRTIPLFFPTSLTFWNSINIFNIFTTMSITYDYQNFHTGCEGHCGSSILVFLWKNKTFWLVVKTLSHSSSLLGILEKYN